MHAETLTPASQEAHPGMEPRFHWRQWGLVVVAAVALALLSWLTNITSTAQMSGKADGFLAFRFTISMLANSGTAWAGLAILCGWLVRRPLQAAIAGVVGSLLSLTVHYSLGRLSGMFDPDIWAENSDWFVLGLVACGPLGLIGAAARRIDVWGLVARLVVPVGAVLEPLILGMFTPIAMMNWPDRFSSIACGILLTVIGVASSVVVLTGERRRRRNRRDAHVPHTR